GNSLAIAMACHTVIFVSIFVCLCASAAGPLSLHDALPISSRGMPRSTSSSSTWDEVTRPPVASRLARMRSGKTTRPSTTRANLRSEEHTSELQSRENLVCRLLLEKKKPLPLDAVLMKLTDL